MLQNSQEDACARVSFNQLFSCKFCKMFKGNFFYRTPPVAVLERVLNTLLYMVSLLLYMVSVLPFTVYTVHGKFHFLEYFQEWYIFVPIPENMYVILHRYRNPILKHLS